MGFGIDQHIQTLTNKLTYYIRPGCNRDVFFARNIYPESGKKNLKIDIDHYLNVVSVFIEMNIYLYPVNK